MAQGGERTGQLVPLSKDEILMTFRHSGARPVREMALMLGANCMERSIFGFKDAPMGVDRYVLGGSLPDGKCSVFLTVNPIGNRTVPEESHLLISPTGEIDDANIDLRLTLEQRRQWGIEQWGIDMILMGPLKLAGPYAKDALEVMRKVIDLPVFSAW